VHINLLRWEATYGGAVLFFML